MKSLAAGIAKAGSTDTKKLVEAFKGLKVDSPFGPFSYRAIDHQATMGAFVGKTALEERQGHDGGFQICRRRAVLPPDDEVKKLRPASANQFKLDYACPRDRLSLSRLRGRVVGEADRGGGPPRQDPTRLRAPRGTTLPCSGERSSA